jgi:hypothetical protein
MWAILAIVKLTACHTAVGVQVIRVAAAGAVGVARMALGALLQRVMWLFWQVAVVVVVRLGGPVCSLGLKQRCSMVLVAAVTRETTSTTTTTTTTTAASSARPSGPRC